MNNYLALRRNEVSKGGDEEPVDLTHLFDSIDLVLVGLEGLRPFQKDVVLEAARQHLRLHTCTSTHSTAEEVLARRKAAGRE